MASIAYTTAFSRFGAKLANPNWAVTAIADDGSLVISCWAHYFKPANNGTLHYIDSLTRWKGSNVPGLNLLREHLEQAVASNLDVRLVIATTDDTASIDSGGDASKVSKTFSVRSDLIGKVTEFDGDNFLIEFRKAAKAGS